MLHLLGLKWRASHFASHGVISKLQDPSLSVLKLSSSFVQDPGTA